MSDKLMTRREYAISKGLAQPGKGRMSNAARDAIAAAEAEGMRFADPAPVSIKEKVKARAAAPKPTAPKTPAQETTQESPVREYRAFTGRFEAIMPNGKRKALSDRTACQCKASLSYCQCKVPTVGLLIVDPTADDTEAVVEIARV